MTQHHESAFETEICEHLAENGWLYSPTDAGYDRESALFPEDVFGGSPRRSRSSWASGSSRT